MKKHYEMANRHGQTMLITEHPSKIATKGTVVLHHGFPGGSNSPTIIQMARVFNKHGLLVIAPDTTNNFHCGDLAKMTMAGHCNDLEDVVRATVDSVGFQGPLVIAGNSAGGHSALVVSSRLAKEEQYRPALTIASSPVISGQSFINAWGSLLGPDAMADWQRKGVMLAGSDVDNGASRIPISWDIMLEWAEHDLIRDKIAPENPTIVIHPNDDSFIPVADIVGYAAMAGNKETHFIKDANHGYNGQEKAFSNRLEDVVTRQVETWNAPKAAMI